MITSRRTFLAGLGAALITAPAIVRAASLMPVKQMVCDPLYRGIRYQTWPFDSPRPSSDYFSGACNMLDGFPDKPASYWMGKIGRWGRPLYYELMEPRA